MADTSNAFAMVTINMTVEPLTSTYGGKTYAAITTTTEVACFTGPGNGPTTLDSLPFPGKFVTLALARPWLWTRVSSQDGKDRIAFEPHGQAPVSDSMQRPDDAFMTWLSKPLDDLATDGLHFAQGPDVGPSWHHALENALRLPGQVGRMLGLSHFLSPEAPGTFATPVKAPDFDALANEVNLRIHAQASPVLDAERYFALEAPYKNRYGIADGKKQDKDEFDHYAYTLSCDTPGVDLSSIFLFARVHRYEVRNSASSAKHPWIDEYLWIQFPTKFDYWSGRDWFSRLPMDVAEAADLPRCFAAGLKNWALNQPAAAGPEGSEDIGLLDAFIRLLPATYGLGAGRIVEGDDEIEAQYRAAPTFSTAHSVLWGMLGPVRTGDEDRYFLPEFFRPKGKSSEPPKGTPAETVLNIWRGLKTFPKVDVVPSDQSYKDHTIILDKSQTQQYIVLLIKTLKIIYSDQAMQELIKKLYIAATYYGNLQYYGDDNDVILWLAGYPKPGTVPLDQSTIDNAEKQFSTGTHFDDNWKAINKDLASGKGWTWTDLANFIDSLSIKLHDAKFVSALTVARWVDELNDNNPADAASVKALKDVAAKSLQQRKPEAVAAAQKVALPQRLTLDNMRDFWTTISEGSDKGNGTPASIQYVRQRLEEYIENRLKAVKIPAFDLVNEKNVRLSSQISAEIDYYVQRVGGDPDKKDTDDPELGSSLVVDVPQPLTFQVGAITGGSQEERDDLKQRLAGFGVLVRNASSNASSRDWYCLTLGQLIPQNGLTPPTGGSPPTEPRQRRAEHEVFGHNPWRIVTQAGLDGWVVPFHGAPLTAKPVLHDTFDTYDDAGSTPDQNAERKNYTPLYDVLQIIPPEPGAASKLASLPRWDRLLALAYGRRYEFAFFAQARSGAFPPGLTNAASPTEFRLPDDTAFPNPEVDPRIIRLRYLRRTAIGAPKLLKDALPSATPEPAEFPLPSREEPWPVFPLAEDLVGRGVLIDPKTVYSTDGDPLANSGYPDPSNPKALDRFENRARPVADEIGRLAVLVPLSKQKDPSKYFWGIDAGYWDKAARAARPLRFAIAPPSVSVNDWVLWRTRDLDFAPEDKAIRGDIQQILTAFHNLDLKAAEVRASEIKPPSDGRAPDDPAVEHLVIRVWRVFDGHDGSGRAQLGTWSTALKGRDRKSDKSDQMLHWQTKSLPIQITAFESTENEADLDQSRPPEAQAPQDWGKHPIKLTPKPGDKGKSTPKPVEELIPPGSPGVEFLVNQGSVYRFEFFAGVPDKHFADSGNAAGIEVAKNAAELEVARIRTLTPAFSLGPDRDQDPKDALRAKLPDLYTIPGGGGEQIRLLSMNAVTVEVAASGFVESIGRDEVWGATDILASSGSLLTVGLKNWGENREWRFWQAKRTMLNRQLWGWTGRTYRHPVAEFASGILMELNQSADRHDKPRPLYVVQPRETFAGSGDRWRTFVEEDGAWFGDRADLDSTVSMGLLTPPQLRAQGDAGAPDCCATPAVPTGVPAGPNDGKPAVFGEALQSGPVYRISLDHDRRAQYWRFSARLESRYIGLLAPDARNEQGRVRGGWRRILIKARPSDRLPTPKLKFILPLTEPFDFCATTPVVPVSSLLVMLEEQWGETTGFAERLVAQVTPWTDAASKKPSPDGRREIGIDPIASAIAPTPSGQQNPLTVDAWPVGLTYDLDIDRPRPAATAFQVRLDNDWLKGLMDRKTPPHVMAQDVMAMVQFRRISDNALTTVEAEVEGTASYVSEWTKPEWVVFNADARYWRIQNAESGFVHVKDLRMNPDGSIAQQDSHGKLSPALLCPNDPCEPSSMMRLLFAVVTEEIFVADGSKTEIFLAVGEIKPNATRPNYAGYTPMPAATDGSASANPAAPPRRGRNLRLLEIEMHRRASELYQDDNFKRGWEIRELVNNGYNDAADNYFATMSKDPLIQTQKQNFIEAFPKDGAKHWLWRMLFPPADQNKTFTSDAVARIRRVSPPIAMTEQADSSA